MLPERIDIKPELSPYWNFLYCVENRINAKAGLGLGKSKAVERVQARHVTSLRYSALVFLTFAGAYLCYPGWFG